MLQSNCEITLVVQNSKGLHARPTAKLVKVSEEFSSKIEISYKGLTVSAKSIMGILMLNARYGAEIKVQAEGQDAQAALNAIETLFNAKFEEE